MIIGSGFFIALFCRNNQHYQSALNMKEIIDERKWITTWPVLSEVSAYASVIILAEKLGHGEIVSTDQRYFRT